MLDVTGKRRVKETHNRPDDEASHPHYLVMTIQRTIHDIISTSKQEKPHKESPFFEHIRHAQQTL